MSPDRSRFRTWRPWALVREAIANVVTSPRAVFLYVVAGLLAGSVVVAELAAMDSALASRTAVEAAGIHVVVATGDAGVDASACAMVPQSVQSVAAAGAIWFEEPVVLRRAPGTRFSTAGITDGALTIVGLSPAPLGTTPGVMLGVAAADELGVVVGDHILIERNPPVAVHGIVDTRVRASRLDRTVLDVRPPVGRADECWIESVPGVAGAVEGAVAAALGDREVGVAPLVRLGEFARDPRVEFDERPSAKSVWAAAGVLGLVGWLFAFSQRPRIGLYRALGTDAAGLFVLGMVEIAVPFCVGSLTGALWGAAAWFAATGAPVAADQMSIALRTAASAVLVGVLVGVVIWPALSRASLVDQLKER